MSLFSRNTGGGRRGLARMAAVFAGTLMAYLVVTAIPASANPATCVVNGGLATELDFTLGVDEHATLAVSDGTAAFAAIAAGTYVFTVQNPATGNYPAFSTCGAGATTAAIDWVNVVGTNAGQESFTLFRPAAASAEAMTVNLGNGTDSFIVDYGGFQSPPYAAAFADPGLADFPDLGTSGGGALVMDTDTGIGVTADVLVNNAENVTINGGNGADTFDAGNDWDIAAKDLIADPVTGDNIPAASNPYSGNLTINGQAGSDVLFSGDGNDAFNGGPDTDTVAYSAPAFAPPENGFTAASAVTVDLAAGTATGMGTDTLTDVQNATGSDNNDTLTGNALDNVLSGGLGADTIDGAAGNDTLVGDAGSDTFVEGTGANGADTVTGGAGAADTVDLRGRTSALYIAPGVASSSGEGGCPLGAGCEGDTYAASNEVYMLGSAADTFVGSATGETVMPGAGDDNVDGNGGTDYLDLSDAAGPAVFDMITGTATGNGTDTFADIEGFVGTGADDSVLATDGAVPVDFIGGAGVDTVDASASAFGVVINLSLYSSVPPDVENVIGGSGGDTLTGNALGNGMWGNDGFDTILGGPLAAGVCIAGSGNDFIEGGLGNDTLNGCDGGNTLSYVHSTTGMVIDNQLGFTQGIGGVGDGEDSLAFFQIVLGSDFGDEITAGQTDVGLNNRLLGRGGDDVIVGTNSSDLIKGGGGADYLRGGGGDDDVYGAAGNDHLFGSTGDDYLRGGKGYDVGNGGKGADVCTSIEEQTSC